MKKLYIIGISVLLCCFTFSNQVKASIDINIWVTINDLNTGQCHIGAYTGTYHIKVEFLTNDEVECTHDFYTTSTHPNLTWTCDQNWDAYKNHSIRITVCHWNSLTGDYCCGNGGGGYYTADYIESGNLDFTVEVN